MIKHVTWTGGSRPRPFIEVKRTPEGDYIRKLYDEEVAMWESFWETRCPREISDLFWGRARYDAHATFREAARQEEKS